MQANIRNGRTETISQFVCGLSYTPQTCDNKKHTTRRLHWMSAARTITIKATRKFAPIKMWALARCLKGLRKDLNESKNIKMARRMPMRKKYSSNQRRADRCVKYVASSGSPNRGFLCSACHAMEERYEREVAPLRKYVIACRQCVMMNANSIDELQKCVASFSLMKYSTVIPNTNDTSPPDSSVMPR